MIFLLFFLSNLAAAIIGVFLGLMIRISQKPESPENHFPDKEPEERFLPNQKREICTYKMPDKFM